jgi:hypothetical protein
VKKKVRLFGALTITSALLFSACSSAQVGKKPEETKPKNQITQAEFQSALEMLQIKTSEWREGIFVNEPEGSSSSNALQGKVSASLSLSLNKIDSKADWKFNVGGIYFGEEWMFHQAIDIKSTTGVVNIAVKPSSRLERVEVGFVYEVSATDLSKTETESLCKVGEGQSLKFRISGLGKTGEAVRTIEVGKANSIKNLCLVYRGLQQGLIAKELIQLP